MKSHQSLAFSLTTLVAALLAALGPARADEADEVKKLVTPESEVSLGGGYVFNQNTQWGKFTGMTEDQAYGLVDLHVVHRDDATGMWLRLDGWNLGLQDRELRFEQSVQGNWGYFLDYNQIPFNQPLTIFTRTSGIGTPFQNPAGLATAVPYDLETRRDRFTVGASKVLGKGFDVTVTYRNENKEGNRRWGNQGPNFLAEPIEFQTNQLDAAINYAGEKLQFQAGYYGSTFNNSNQFVQQGTTQVSLPPDNESWQAYLSGGYNFTPTTRANFKVSYTQYTQNEAFYAAPAPAGTVPPFPLQRATGVGSLNGKVDSTRAEAGIISRPITNLTLRADWRYEDRDDQTPFLKYITESPGGCTTNCSRDGFNVPMSRTTNILRGEAQYRLPMGFVAIAGVGWDKREYVVPPPYFRQVSWRGETQETSYRAELRRSLSETLNGSLSYVYSDKHGSPYLPANNNAAADVIDPVHWGNRTGDKLRFRLDWAPLDPLSVQFTADYASYDYDERPLGPQSGSLQFYGVDAAYSISDNWQLVGWASMGRNKWDQATIGAAALNPPVSAAVGPDAIWSADLRNTTYAIGAGVRGKPMAKLEVGADVQWQEDQDEYNVFATSGNLPSVGTHHTTVTVFGKYAVSPNSGVKLQYIYDYWSTNDWAWAVNPFAVFTNNTLVYFQSPQTVNFVGATYYYKWQ